MIVRLSLWKDYRERNLINFIWFSFLTFLAFIEVYVLAIATCAICFTGKISRVHTSVVIDLQRMSQEKHFVSVKSTTWMVPGHVK